MYTAHEFKTWLRKKQITLRRKKQLCLVFFPFILLCFVCVNYTLRFSGADPPLSCTPRKNIVFLKTHKCASTSIQNIFMRYGDLHNLTFVLPDRANYLGHPDPFDMSFVEEPHLEEYNIFTHHTRFNNDRIRELMSEDTLFITIVRDPAYLFESIYSYYNLKKKTFLDFEEFLNLPTSKDSLVWVNGIMVPVSFVTRKRAFSRIGINQMMFDLGANVTIMEDEALSSQYVELVDSWFDFVLITERMDESLVMLKELLCWSIDDVATFKLNKRNPKDEIDLTDEDKSKLRVLNAADQILYDNFLSKFDQQVEKFGPDRLRKEVAILRQRTKLWHDYCIDEIKPSRELKTMKIFSTNVDNYTCKAMTANELDYTEYLRLKQRGIKTTL